MARVLPVLLVLVAVAAAVWPSLSNEFSYDDATIVRAQYEAGGKNEMVAELRPIGDYFTREYWTGTGAAALQSNPLYRPVTVWSYAVTHALAPGDGTLASEARPHHLANVLLHLLNTLLVFWIVREFSSGPPERRSFGPLAAAAVFGLAGIHAEAIAAIVGRADLLAFLFGAGALSCVLRLRRSDGSRWARWGLSAVAAVLLFLGFCSKESALAWWPFLWCAVLASNWSRGSSGGFVTAVAIGVIPAAAWWFLRGAAFEGLPDPAPVAYVANPLVALDGLPRMCAAAGVWGYSAWKMIVPFPLVSDYGAVVFPFADRDGGGWLSLLLCLLPLVGVVVLGVWSVVGPRRRPLFFLGTSAFLVLGFITSNVPVTIGTIWAERLAYLPSLALAFVAAGLAGGGSGKGRRAMPVAAIVAWTLFGFGVLFVRVDDWRNDAVLFSTDVERQPRSLMLRLQAAIQAQRSGDWDAWRGHLEAALRIEPHWARPYIELAAGRVMLAAASAPTEPRARANYIAPHLAAAEKLLRRGLAADIIEDREKPMLWRNLAVVLLKSGRAAESFGWFERILALEPDDVRQRHLVLVDGIGAFTDAQFESILVAGETRQRGHPLWRMHRGLQSARRRDWAAARQLLESALPDVALFDRCVQRAWFDLADLRERTGDRTGARELFARIAGNARFDPSIRTAATQRAQ